MKKQIMLRSVLIALAASLIVFLAAIGVVYFVSDSNIKNNIMSDTKVYADILKSGAPVAILEGVADFDDMRVTLVDADGDVLFESDTDAALENHADREEFSSAMDGRPQIVRRYSSTMGYNMYYYAVGFESGGATYYLRIAERTSNIGSYIWPSLPFFIFAMAVAAVISYFFSKRMAQAAAEKIRSVGDSLKSINSGEYKPIVTDMRDAELFGILTEMNELFSGVKNNISAIKREQNKLDFVLNNMSQGVIAFTPGNNIALINRFACDLFGVAEKQAVGQKVIWLIDDTTLSQKLGGALEKEHDDEFSYRLGDKDLNFKIYSLSKSNLSGEISNIVLIADLTNEKAAIRQKSEFFANASHELKTPLTSMQGLTELLLAKGNGDEQEKKYLQRIYNESKRMSNLVLDMLYISDLENGVAEKHAEDIDLEAVAGEVKQEYAHQTEEKNISVTVSGKGRIKADYRNIYELVGNLFSNAVHYNKNGGKIDVTIETSADGVRLTVEDSGIGIAKEHIPKLCERFYRVDKSRSKKTGGTGLGLAIVKHICNLYGAKLGIQSALGKGTKVTVDFKNDTAD